MLEVGSKVLIKSFESLLVELGDNGQGIPDTQSGFNSIMAEFCGEVMTIAKCEEDKAYYMKEDNGQWAWDEETFTLLKAIEHEGKKITSKEIRAQLS